MKQLPDLSVTQSQSSRPVKGSVTSAITLTHYAVTKYIDRPSVETTTNTCFSGTRPKRTEIGRVVLLHNIIPGFIYVIY